MVILYITVIWFISTAVSSKQLDRARGVALSKRVLYDPTKDFQCLDGLKTISFNKVNNNYCDCADGSDEPGTSACANGRFYCVNIGHRPQYIPSGRVNDGICDCCDGSDEWDGHTQCDNICLEIGREARLEAEKQLATIKAGYANRQQLAKDGQKLVEENAAKLVELKQKQEELTVKKVELQADKDEKEKLEREAKEAFDKAHEEERNIKRREEATKVFNKLDLNQDQKLTLDEIKPLTEFDDNNDGQIDDSEAKKILKDVDSSDLEHFVDKVWLDFRLLYKDPEQAEATTTAAPVSEEPLPEEEEDIGDEDVEKVDSYETEKRNREAVSRLKFSESESRPDYDDATRALITAADDSRNAFRTVDNELREVDNAIADAEALSGSTFGIDHAWAPLKGTCLEHTDPQYVYTLCLFEKSTQKPKNGGGETSLGKWGKWLSEEDNEHHRQLYENGQGCWNGPSRSTKVNILCGIETKLTAASEPAKCEYEFTMESPAACPDPTTVTQPLNHEEL